MTLPRGLVTAMAASVLALGFASCDAGPREPRAINPAADVCEVCRMTVIPEGHAAQALGEDGTVRVFDDPGCLALAWHDHPADYAEYLAFVQDAGTKAWVAWEAATLVRADDVASPMNYGWHAFAEESTARSFAAEHTAETTRVVTAGPQLATLAVLAEDLKDRRWQP